MARKQFAVAHGSFQRDLPREQFAIEVRPQSAWTSPNLSHLVYTRRSPFHCPVEGCGQRFTRKFAINDHLKRMHEKSRKFKCSQCEFSTKCKTNLLRHEAAWHGDQNARCDVQGCGKSFAPSQLQPHRRRVHKLYVREPAGESGLEIHHTEIFTDDQLDDGHIVADGFTNS